MVLGLRRTVRFPRMIQATHEDVLDALDVLEDEALYGQLRGQQEACHEEKKGHYRDYHNGTPAEHVDLVSFIRLMRQRQRQHPVPPRCEQKFFMRCQAHGHLIAGVVW